MWTAKIEQKDFSNGQFRVFVSYTDGTNKFEENYSLSTQENLHKTVRSRLQQLESVAVFASTVPIGVFNPSAEEVKPLSSYDLALQEVARVKGLVNIGILKETDTVFVNAVTALKLEYAKL